MKLPDLHEADVTLLEDEMDCMNIEPELRALLFAGRAPAVSQAHVVSCVCRRAERMVIQLARSHQSRVYLKPFVGLPVRATLLTAHELCVEEARKGTTLSPRQLLPDAGVSWDGLLNPKNAFSCGLPNYGCLASSSVPQIPPTHPLTHAPL
jgi:hypothetical protein